MTLILGLHFPTNRLKCEMEAYFLVSLDCSTTVAVPQPDYGLRLIPTIRQASELPIPCFIS